MKNNLNISNNSAQTSAPIEYNRTGTPIWVSNEKHDTRRQEKYEKYDTRRQEKYLKIIRSWGHNGIITNIIKCPSVIDFRDPPQFRFLCDGIEKSCSSVHKKKHEAQAYYDEHVTTEIYYDYDYGEVFTPITDTERTVLVKKREKEEAEYKKFLEKQAIEWRKTPQ